MFQDALGLAGHILKMEKEQLTPSGERSGKVGNRKKLRTYNIQLGLQGDWATSRLSSAQVLGFLHLAYCVPQGKLSPFLARFLSFNIGGPTSLPQKVGVGRCRSEIQNDTGNQKLHFVL